MLKKRVLNACEDIWIYVKVYDPNMITHIHEVYFMRRTIAQTAMFRIVAWNK